MKPNQVRLERNVFIVKEKYSLTEDEIGMG
jgi:hypothetical protein